MKQVLQGEAKYGFSVEIHSAPAQQTRSRPAVGRGSAIAIGILLQAIDCTKRALSRCDVGNPRQTNRDLPKALRWPVDCGQQQIQHYIFHSYACIRRKLIMQISIQMKYIA